jgi:hypothetical protein
VCCEGEGTGRTVGSVGRSRFRPSQGVDGARNCVWPGLQDVRVDLGCLHVDMAKQFLHGADVVSGFEKMGGIGMPEGMGMNRFLYAGLVHGVPDGLAQDTGVEVVSSYAAAAGVTAELVRREDVLPAKLLGGVGILAGEGFWHLDLAESFGKVHIMTRPG